MPHLSQFVGRPFGNGEVADVAIGAGGFVAVGSIRPDLYSLLPTVWWSPDGRLWAATNVPDLDPEATVLDAVAYDESHGFVVAGRGGATGSAGTVGELDIWHSADGRSWTAAQVADAQLPDAFERMQMAASTTGFVIAVRDCSASACRLRAWRSTDGQSWTPSELAASDPPLAGIHMDVVAASDAGYAVVGTSCRRSLAKDVVLAADCAPFTQTSTDGETWQTAYGPRSGRCCWSSVYHAVMAPDGRVLMDGEVGRTNCHGGDNCVLRTIEQPMWMFDGQQWAQLRPVLDGIGDVASLGALGRSDDSWLALADGALWASADGTRWTLVDRPTGAMPVDAYIAFAGTRGIVVGFDKDVYQHVVWLFDLSAR